MGLKLAEDSESRSQDLRGCRWRLISCLLRSSRGVTYEMYRTVSQRGHFALGIALMAIALHLHLPREKINCGIQVGLA